MGGVPAMMKESAKAIERAAGWAAPIMTGGASLPVQALVQAGGTAAQTAAEGATPKQIGTAAAIGAAIPLGAEGLTQIGGWIAKQIPDVERAGKVFQELRATIGHHTVDIAEPGNVALEIQDLASRGGQMPKVVRDFIKRTTDPTLPPLTYAEARDFYSNASRISVDEAQRLAPQMRMQLTRFTKALGGSIQDTTDSAGRLDQYMNAMKEYASAKQLEAFKEHVKDIAIQTLKYGTPAGIAGYAVRKGIDIAAKD
jgi:hypothetical protein